MSLTAKKSMSPGSQGIMPTMTDKAKSAGLTPSRPSAPSFGEFTITEDTSEPG